MTNGEKIQKLIDDKNHSGPWQEFHVVEIAMRIAEWKEQQAIEYLYKNIKSLLKDYGVSEASADIATQLFLANFKQAMEE